MLAAIPSYLYTTPQQKSAVQDQLLNCYAEIDTDSDGLISFSDFVQYYD